MKPENIKAIKRSIMKWDLICHGVHADYGGADCALCDLYIDIQCENCPIGDSGYTRAFCKDTPYIQFLRSFDLCKKRYIKNSFSIPRACYAAAAEVEFLISLLPEEERKAYDT